MFSPIPLTTSSSRSVIIFHIPNQDLNSNFGLIMMKLFEKHKNHDSIEKINNKIKTLSSPCDICKLTRTQ
jgi:hypothetical protein